eukprot:scaffold24040_cov67-Phaeocystis_antarctica.AAC.3
MAHTVGAAIGVVRVVNTDGAGGGAWLGPAEDHREQDVGDCEHHQAATAASLVMEAVASGARKDLRSGARTQLASAEGIVALGIGRPAVKSYWVLSRRRPLCRHRSKGCIGPGGFCRSTWWKIWRAGSTRGGCFFSLQQAGLLAGLLARRQCLPSPFMRTCVSTQARAPLPLTPHPQATCSDT